MSKIIQGKELMLFVDGKTIAYATNHSLSLSTETQSNSHKDIRGDWDSIAVKKFSWTASTENLYGVMSTISGTADGTNCGAGQDWKTLFDAYKEKKVVDVWFGVAGDTLTAWASSSQVGGWEKSGTGLTGKALITSLNFNAPDGDNATFTCEFTGVGELEVA